MKNYKKLILFFTLLTVGMFFSHTALAVPWQPLVPCGIFSQGYTACTFCDLFKLFKNLFDFLAFEVAPALAAALFAWAGFTMLSAGSSQQRFESGKTIFKDVIIGLVILYVSWIVINTAILLFAKPIGGSGGYFSFTCQAPPTPGSPVQSSVPPTTSSPAASGSPSASGVSCQDSGINLCQASQQSCPSNACSQYSTAINSAASQVSISGINTKALVAAIMFNESSCNISSVSGSGACGLMQMLPSTANIFKNICGVTENITCQWLTDPANASASICIGAQYLQSIAQGTCGSEVRNIAAGYNGGEQACQSSASCSGETGCDGSPVKKWECLYDDTQHTVCNTGFEETRQYAPKVLACYNTNN